MSSRYFLDGERVSSEFFFSLSCEQRESVDVFGETVGGVGGSGEGEEKKVETITIVLSDQAGEKMQFKVKKDTKFQKVFDAYASRLGVPVNSLTFRFDGERITGENTPKMLEMEDEDMIEVLMQQVGGSGEEDKKVLPETITIEVLHNGENVKFKVKKEAKLQKVFDAFASRLGVPVATLRFQINGERITGEHTPKMLEMDEEDKIEVLMEQTGGSGEEEKKVETITIVLSDQAGEKMQFKVKKDTKFQKVFDAYASRLGVPVNSLTFRFDGERITGENTPKMLEMEDEDMIEVLMQQVGGSGEGEEKKVETITIVLSDQAGEKMQFKVKKDTKFQKVFDAYASRLGVPVNSLTFRFDGERITGENTPKMLEMEDEDMIEVLMQQVGGSGEEDKKVPETITIVLSDQAGEKMQFKVKKDTKFQKVFDAYASRLGVPVNSLTFRFDGERITGENTPKMLEMEDEDMIEVLMQQVGGR